MQYIKAKQSAEGRRRKIQLGANCPAAGLPLAHLCKRYAMETLHCSLPVVPMRREPAHRSEMVNQLLFGETCVRLGAQEDWVMVRLGHDGYTGWVQEKQLRAGEGAGADPWYLEAPVQCHEGHWLFAGSMRPAVQGEPGWVQQPSSSAARLRQLTGSFLGAPYLWGGRTVAGFDCSGFVQVVFRLCGRALPRDASQQVAEGAVVDFVEEARPGDLAFFDSEEGHIIHVGIITELTDGGAVIVHASGEVRQDLLDHHGIFNGIQKNYSHRLRALRRPAAFY